MTNRGVGEHCGEQAMLERPLQRIYSCQKGLLEVKCMFLELEQGSEVRGREKELMAGLFSRPF